MLSFIPKNLLVITTCLFIFASCNNSTTNVSKGTEPTKESPQDQLKGVWSVISYPFDSKTYKPTKPYAVSFDGNNAIGMKLSVNSCSAAYSVPKTGVLRFTGTTICTEACCDNEESVALRNLFAGELSYSVNKDILTIKSTKGDIVFQKKAE